MVGFFEDQVNDSMPIPRLDRMPVRINPCPIIEAIIEIRFVSTEPWRTMPGLLFSHIRERYTVSRDLPLATFPEDFRRQNPALMYLPLVQFVRSNFLIQFGPRVVSLVYFAGPISRMAGNENRNDLAPRTNQDKWIRFRGGKARCALYQFFYGKPFCSLAP